MAGEELANLSFKELVDRIAQLQAEVSQLKARIAELEGRPLPQSALTADTAHEESATVSAPVAWAHSAPEPILTPGDLEEPARTRRSSRRHRKWYQRVWRAIAPRSIRMRRSVVAITLLVIGISIVSVFFLTNLLASGTLRFK